MGKVLVVAAVLTVIIGGVAVGIFVIGGSAKLTSLFWREKKDNEERSDEN